MTDPTGYSQRIRTTGTTSTTGSTGTTRRTGPPNPTPPPRRASRALDAALRAGPFETALQLAISDSGLSLDSLRRRLATDGIHVGLSTLSYWQRGLRRPERAESLRAVRAIEDLCGLPRSSLVALLGPRRPRGRWGEPRNRELDIEELLGDDMLLAMTLSDLDVSVNSRSEHVSVHGDRWMHADRSWSTERIRRIVIARTEGVDRFVALSLRDIDGEQPPSVRAMHGCRLGRVRTDPATGLHAAELLFDRRLSSGQVHVFDYEYQAGPGSTGVTRYDYGSRQPLRELVLRAHFTPDRLPVRCYQVVRRRYHDDSGLRDVQELQPDAHGVIQLVSLNGKPGIEGFRWEWD
ncbi:hypothetical protein ABH940_002455 [Streptacidiphilus sp. BW17]|uniref:hypothetical protein n=1 Tax=Streptacidiphilus sp. BW17 TaxID=3156274 RepID=UPI0035181535